MDQAKSGTYRAPPVRRVYIPKGTGNETRPIGIPTFADKVLWAAFTAISARLRLVSFAALAFPPFRPCARGTHSGSTAAKRRQAP